jgi:ATP-binding cassette subfamily F protein 3
MEVEEEKERLGKMKLQAALDKKRMHVEASIANGRKTAAKTGDDNRSVGLLIHDRHQGSILRIVDLCYTCRMRMVKSREKKLEDRWGLETSDKGTRFKLSRDRPGFHATRREEINVRGIEREITISIDNPPQLRVKGPLIHVEKVGFAYDEKKKKMILENVNMTVYPGERVALVGANGQGKSTLAKVIIGELVPTIGKVESHPYLRIGYFSQVGALLPL